MQIFITTSTGFRISLPVEPSDTISFLKAKIQNNVGIPADRQILSLTDEQLEDEQTISDFEITNDSILNLGFVNNSLMQIYISFISGEKILLEAKPSNSILDVKIKIQNKKGIHPDQQRIVCNGELLEDEKTLSEYNIGNQANLNFLRIEYTPIKIYFREISGKKTPLTVNPTDTIEQVLNKYMENSQLLGRPVRGGGRHLHVYGERSGGHQTLYYRGKVLQLDQTIFDYKIKKEGTIYRAWRTRPTRPPPSGPRPNWGPPSRRSTRPSYPFGDRSLRRPGDFHF